MVRRKLRAIVSNYNYIHMKKEEVMVGERQRSTGSGVNRPTWCRAPRASKERADSREGRKGREMREVGRRKGCGRIKRE
ncbi:hypothetical protein E2C01_101132 [Portunus trituberculatus]|uniref:Uncharacterized protein n=1 Tax=Portunus trituberculatus TaxID=210409 RepID=A0A5B7K4X6_PORTR|nr:hypothetical protein [Portunus trituberculatus]